LYTRTHTYAYIDRARNKHIYIHICRYFLSIRSFFSILYYSSKKRKTKTSSLFLLSCIVCMTRKSFALRPCKALLLSSSSSLRRCVCIYFFFISIAALACALMVMVCTGMLFSADVVLFLLFFVFFRFD
jgi:hypothetical protein